MLARLKQNNRFRKTAFILIIAVTGRAGFSQAPDAFYLAGSADMKKGAYVNAVENFTSAISHNNADERLFIKRGMARLQLKDFEGAVADFEEANLIYPGVADLWLSRSFALSGDNEKAVSYLESHLKSEFRLPEDSIRRDPAFDGLQASAEWETLWQHEWYSKEEKIAREIEYYRKKQMFDMANSILSVELSASPENRMLLALRGRVSLDQENYAASIADYSAAIELDKNDAAVYPMRAVAYSKAGRYRDAVNDLNRAIRSDPAWFTLYVQRAEAYAAMQSWEPAIKDMTYYLKYFGEDQAAIHQCGEYCFESGDYINALKYFNINLKEDPDNSVFFKSRGKTYLKTATYRYAISDLSMSLDLDPGDAETWMYLGMAKIATGDRENGCSDLERARKMGENRAVSFILENCR